MQNLWKPDNLLFYAIVKLLVILFLLSVLYLATRTDFLFHPFYFSPFFCGT